MEVRLIARLDIKGAHLIKPINLEGVRKVGDPREFVTKYYHQGVDEVLYMDAVASLYGRNNLSDLVKETVVDTFVPITVGGGIRSLNDVDEMLRSGADKIAINSAAIRDPSLLDAIAKRFGSQCLVLSIEAKASLGGYEAYCDGGREKTGKDAIEWAKEAADRGAGEILVTSVDYEGMRSGFDIQLYDQISTAVSLPIIASGGMGNLQHLKELVSHGGVEAFAAAHVLHFNVLSAEEILDFMRQNEMRSR